MINNRPEYFDLHEVVCPHTYYLYGEWVWQFFDYHFLEVIDWIRLRLGPTYANNWWDYRETDYIKYIKERCQNKLPIIRKDVPKPPDALLDERGARCNMCDTYLKKTDSGIIYLSAHFRWQAGDLDIQGKVAEEVRQWLIANQIKIPHPVRLEKNVRWVHLDCPGNTDIKVQLINP